jgi:hypothetical protein
MSDRPSPQNRSSYRAFRSIPTRWADNDMYGHVNNVVYYGWFDTAVNAHLIERGALDIHQGTTMGFVVETQCNYFAPLAFPQTVEAGIRVAYAGSSSAPRRRRPRGISSMCTLTGSHNAPSNFCPRCSRSSTNYGSDGLKKTASSDAVF